MQANYDDEFEGNVIYLDGDENNHEEGNVVNELNFHCMISFTDYEQLTLGMDTMCDRNSSLEAELAAAKKKIAELEKNQR
jgi:hypothetical protein